VTDASLAQHGIWFTEQVVDAGSSYHIPLSITFSGDLNVEALLGACADVVARHPLLGSALSEVDGALRVVPAAQPVPIRLADTDEVVHPFDLRHGPLARFSLTPLAPQGFRLMFTAHHAVFDGESKDILVGDLAACYAARVNGTGPDLPTIPPYAEHVAGERQRVADATEAAKRYWAGRWHPDSAVLPGLTGEPTARGGESITLPTDPGLDERLGQLTRELRVSRFELLAGALLVLLHRYGNAEPSVAVDLSTRTPAHRHAIGVFVNELPVSAPIGPGLPFREFATRVHTELRGRYSHWEVPLARAVTGVPPATSLAPVSLSYRQRRNSPEFPGVTAEVDWMVFNHAARNALHVQAVDGPDGLSLSLRYSRDRLDSASAERIGRHLATLLAGIAADPDTPVDELPLLDSAELAQLATWNDTAADFPSGTTLHEMLAAQAIRTPDATAVVFEGGGLTYAELDARASRIAHRLRGLGVRPDDRVAVCAERCLDLVAGLLGVLKAGAAYLPLDPEYPPARLEFMLADARPAAVLAQQRVCPDTDLPTLLLDADDLDSEPAGDPEAGAGPDDAAYVIYTSGSTGRPKGVVNTHRGIVNRLHWMQREYQLTPADAVLQKTPMSFDVSVWEFFWPLLAGARLVLARPGGHKDVSYLRDLINAQGVTTVHFVPSMLAAFLAEEGACPSLRRVICSGEELPADLARRLVARSDAQLHNLYGPTEAAIDVSRWHCRPELLAGLARVPIGRPIDNITLHLLDAGMRPVPIGVAGELHIGGVGLAREYLGRPELTAERFLPDPDGGGRLYRTGDLARYRPDGALEFLGRIDTQVKIRGQRVELGEIEAALRDRPSVHAAAVALREDTPDDQRLVAYVVPANGRAVEPDELRTALKRTLPEYMVPAAYVPLDALPVTPSGKLDRAALPAPEPAAPAAGSGHAEARTDAERLLVELWQEVLGVEQVGIDDDFFDLGGHSLLATRVVSRLRRLLPPDAPRVTVMDLFARSTIRELAALIEPAAEPTSEPVAESAQPEAPRSKRLWELTKPRRHRRLCLVCVPYGGSSAVVYQPLADALPDDCSLYAVAPPGHDLGVDEKSRPLDAVADEVCTEVLSTVDGPLVLYGHCVGSALTIEIARRLEAAGRKLDAVYIGGSFPFALPRRGILGAFARLSRLERLRSDRYWANWLRSMGADLSGLPAEDIMSMVRVMRGDARDGEDYFTELLEAGVTPLRTPIISVVGERDPITEYYQERYREWHFLTGTAALVVLDEGGHYFLRYRQDELAAIVTGTHEALAAGTADRLTAAARGPDASWWLAGVSTKDTAAPARRSPQPSLRRFLAVATGQLCSITGSALTEFAVPLWIYLKTGSLRWYALAWIVGMLGLLVAPVAGAVVDRCNRRMVMLAADSAAGLGQGVFAVLVLTGHLRLWQIWVILGWLSVALTFQRLAYASAIPQLVPKHFLGHANGVVQLTVGVAQFVVPLIAAAMLAAFDLSGILLFDLISFVIAVGTVAVIRFPATMPHKSRESLAIEIVNGWRYSMGNRYFRGMLGYMGLLNVFLSALILLIFPLVLSFGSLSTLGTVSFIGGAGAALGGLAMALWGGPRQRRMYGMLVSGALLGAFGMVAGLRPNMAVAAAGLAGLFFWLALVNGIYVTIVQVKVPQRYHGRVFALNQMIAWSTIPLGLVVVAPLATRLFEPLLAPGGALSGSVGRVIGVGPGRGIGLAYLVLGLVIVLLVLALTRTRVLSRFDTEVPDALPDDVIGLEALAARRTIPVPRQVEQVKEVSRV
jgi:amino acid adenylation domain-containing protein